MKSKYSDTYFAFQYAVKHKDYTKWFSPVILAVDTWEHSCLTNWGNSREVLFTARARRCENSAQLTQLTGMSALACI